MIKRNLSLILVLCLLLGCAACGTNKPANNTAEETMKVDEAIDSDGKLPIGSDNAAIDADEMMKKRFKYIETKKIDDGSIME